MARPKKKPEYYSDQMAQQLMEAVTDAYLNPPQGTEDDTGHMQLNQLAEEFSMTLLKVRKLLVTTGAYQTAISKAVYKMEERTLLAERLQKYRIRKSEVEKIVEAMASESKEGPEELLWSTLTAFEGYPFRTAKGLRFHYSIKGNGIFSAERKSQ